MRKFLSVLMSLALMVTVVPKVSFAQTEDDGGSQRDSVSPNVFDAAKKFAKGIDGELFSKCGLNPKCTKGADGKGSCDFELKCGDSEVGKTQSGALYDTILPGLIDECGKSLACSLEPDGSGSCKLSLDCSEMSVQNVADEQHRTPPAAEGSSLSWWEVIKSFRWYHHILHTLWFLFLGALIFRN